MKVDIVLVPALRISGKEINGVMMITTIVDVNGMVETVVVVMLKLNIVKTFIFLTVLKVLIPPYLPGLCWLQDHHKT